MNTLPLGISIVIPINSVTFFRSCLFSIYPILKTNIAFECIIIAAEDIYSEVKQLVQNSQIKNNVILKKQTTTNLAGAINEGIRLVSYKYIARLDSDDIRSISMLIKQINYLEIHQEVAGVGGQVVLIDENNKRIGFALYATKWRSLSKLLLAKNAFAHSAMVFRTTILHDIGLYNENLVFAEDWNLYLRLRDVNTIIHNLSVVVVHRRVHKLQKSRNEIFDLESKLLFGSNSINRIDEKLVFWLFATIDEILRFRINKNQLKYLGEHFRTKELFKFPTFVSFCKVLIAIFADKLQRQLLFFRIYLRNLHPKQTSIRKKVQCET